MVLAYLKTMMFCFMGYLIIFLEFPEYTVQPKPEYVIYLNDVVVGVASSPEMADQMYMEARRNVALESETPVFVEVPTLMCGRQEDISGLNSKHEDIVSAMETILRDEQVVTLARAYSVKVNGVVVNVASASEVQSMFQEAVDIYDTEHRFAVELRQDNSRELNVLTVQIVARDSAEETEEFMFPMAGISSVFEENMTDFTITAEEGFAAYEYGIQSMEFSEPVEVVEAYLPMQDIMTAAVAGGLLTEEQEVQQIYKVQSGDTLSEISLTVGLPVDDIIALNDELENENSILHIDQELIITVPQPELSILWTETARYEEAYDLPIEYIYNDSWYTNQCVTRQQPSAGYHEAVALVSRRNDTELSRETLYEEIIFEPVAKVVEIGTIIPPTYIKPLSGGRMTSGFGPRPRPVSGASTNHRGIDWATPIGTSIYASSGGTVVKAGWGSGYGYVIYINHPDGRQTRYGHLSNIYVSVGQYVSQGQVIAASGNTGRSSGPHLHFEILVNGVQVNPMNYLN